MLGHQALIGTAHKLCLKQVTLKPWKLLSSLNDAGCPISRQFSSAKTLCNVSTLLSERRQQKMLVTKKNATSKNLFVVDLKTSPSSIQNFSSSIVRRNDNPLSVTKTPSDKNPLKKNAKILSFLSLKSFASTPFPFLIYGLGGLIPFAAAPVYMQLNGFYDPTIAYYQLVYGATIVSFLGGVSWGESLPHSKKASLGSLAYSIALPLISWVSVLLYPNPCGQLLLMSSIAFAGYTDTQNSQYPLWFRNLRFVLSSLVFACLFTPFIFRYIKPSSSSDNGKK